MNSEISVLVDDAVFPEGPRWHEGAFWYADIGAGHVCRVESGPGKTIHVAGLTTPSGLGWTSNGDLVVSSITRSEVYRVDRDRNVRLLCGPDAHGTRGTNDMVTVGGFSYVTCNGGDYSPGDEDTTWVEGIGTIIRIDHETGECRTVATGLNTPNGCAFTPDGKRFIFSEVFARRVSVFDVTPDGGLENRRLFAAVDGTPDGLTLDAEGAVWVGTGDDFQRYDAHGKRVATIAVPGWHCVACMLGGEDGRSLFLAVSQYDSIDDILNGRTRGRILMTRVDVPVAATPARVG